MTIFVFAILLQIIACSAQSEWSYKDQDAWPPTCKNGQNQSPIEITSEKTVKGCLKKFKFNSATYEKKKATVTNIYYTVAIRFPDDPNPPTISGGGLDGDYILDNLHFHWSAEHTISTYRYPLESHFVYFSAKYKNLEEALTQKNGTAVLAVFYRKTLFHLGKSAFGFVQEIPQIAHKIDQPVVAQHPVVLGDFLPKNCGEFYRYSGSLTIPDCNEGVIWTIFKKSQWISYSEYNKLVKIWDAEDKPVKKNYRDLQPLNGRRVLCSTC